MTADEMLDAAEREAKWLQKLFIKRTKRMKSTEVVLTAWMLAGAKAMGGIPQANQRLVLTMVNSIEGKGVSRIIVPKGVKS